MPEIYASLSMAHRREATAVGAGGRGKELNITQCFRKSGLRSEFKFQLD